MHFQWIQHASSRHDNLLGLLLHRQRANERGHLLGRLPLGQLAQTLLAGPRGSVDNLEVHLARAWLKNEDGTVDGLGTAKKE